MRLALISDIHGNMLALEAVLADCAAQGIDATWFLGDYAAIGPEPAAVLERISTVDGARFLRGNTDRYVCSDDRPPPSLDDVRGDPAGIALYANIGASFAWTRGYVVATGWYDWLAALPLDIRDTVEGTRLLAVHASPGTDDGVGIHPSQSNAVISELLKASHADVVIVGHTHEAMLRQLGSRVLVNLGSVGNPRAGVRGASYAILECTREGVVVEHRRVPYDAEAFAARVAASRHPAAGFIMQHQHGEVAARPRHADHADPIPGVRVPLVFRDGPSRPAAS